MAHVHHAASRHMNCILFDAGGLGNATPTTTYTVANSITASSDWYLRDAFKSAVLHPQITQIDLYNPCNLWQS